MYITINELNMLNSFKLFTEMSYCTLIFILFLP